MKSKSGRAYQVFISYLVFTISGIMIFNPVYNSDNIGLSLLVCLLTSAVIFETTVFVFKKARINKSNVINRFFTILTSLFSIFCTIIYLTEIIKDVSHIAGRGISLLYYTGLALAILAVSYYLCYNTEKGIFRFSILSLSSFIYFILILFLAFISTKEMFRQSSFPISKSSIASGILSGLFLTIDTPIFIGTFKKYLSDSDGLLCTGILRTSYWFSVLFMTCISILPFILLGKDLTAGISDPIYTATKLCPQGDMTEAGSVVKIIGFMIKSSVYIYFSSSKLLSAFKPKKYGKILIIFLLYASIPAIFLTISIIYKSKEYGAFQHLIYAAVTLLGISSATAYFFSNKDI